MKSKIALSVLAFFLMGARTCGGPKTVCESGFEVVGGSCRPIEEDAGPEDAGHVDAPGMDAHVDAPIDSGIDSGPPDAGPCGGPCTGDTPACNAETHECVRCVEDTDCGEGATPACNTETHECVACVSDMHCGGDTPACDEDTNLCVECVYDRHCSDESAPACDATTNTCVACTDDSHCSGDTPVCDTDVHQCVGCLEDADCSGDTAYCDTDAQVCVECLVDANCTSTDSPHCDTGTHECGDCTNSSHCARFDSEHRVCATSGYHPGSCVECTTSSHSACATNHACNSRTNECSTYLEDSQDYCEPCDADEDCAGSQSACVVMRYRYAGSTYLADDARCSHYLVSDTSCPRPFTDTRSALSVGGTTHNFCILNEDYQTCGALLAAQTPCASEAECTPHFSDCVTWGVGGGSVTECVADCESDAECLTGDSCVLNGTLPSGHGICR